jgi:hypothetical protein
MITPLRLLLTYAAELGKDPAGKISHDSFSTKDFSGFLLQKDLTVQF